VLAQCLTNDFEAAAIKIVTKDYLLKALHSGNRQLGECAHFALLGILNHVCVPKIIDRLQKEMVNSKSTLVHAKMSQYLFVLVARYPFEGVLDKYADTIDLFIKQCAENANPEARQNGRRSFLVWQQVSPRNAEALYQKLDYQTKKAIFEEQEKFQMEGFDDKKDEGGRMHPDMGDFDEPTPNRNNSDPA
jgi:hypothetical protein